MFLLLTRYHYWSDNIIRIATAAVLDRSAARLLNGLYQLRDAKNLVAEPTEGCNSKQK